MTAPAGPLRERRLVNGWVAAPHVRVRQARARDLPALAEIVPLAGVPLLDDVAGAVAAGTTGATLRAGLRAGAGGLAPGRLTDDGPEPYPAAVAAATPGRCLVLVAEHRRDGVVGALVAFPPVQLIPGIMARVGEPEGRRAQVRAVLSGCAQVQAVAVAATARGQGTGAALLRRCRDVYFRCGYGLLYGLMPPGRGLPEYYARGGFRVLGHGERLDLAPACGVRAGIAPGGEERVFFRRRLPTARALSTATVRRGVPRSAPGT